MRTNQKIPKPKIWKHPFRPWVVVDCRCFRFSLSLAFVFEDLHLLYFLIVNLIWSYKMAQKSEKNKNYKSNFLMLLALYHLLSHYREISGRYSLIRDEGYTIGCNKLFSFLYVYLWIALYAVLQFHIYGEFGIYQFLFENKILIYHNNTLISDLLYLRLIPNYSKLDLLFSYKTSIWFDNKI